MSDDEDEGPLQSPETVTRATATPEPEPELLDRTPGFESCTAEKRGGRQPFAAEGQGGLLRVTVRQVRADEVDTLKAVRMRALRSDPGVFLSTVESATARPEAFWTNWAAESAEGRTQCTFVAADDAGELHALVFVRPVADGRGRAEILAMWVAPELRGTGVVDELCDRCADWARARGHHTLRLELVVGNDRARRAYERAGFTVTGQSTWSEVGRTIDELVMARSSTRGESRHAWSRT